MDDEITLVDIDLDTVKARSLSGVVTLISRSFILQIVSTIGFFLLSVFLGRPEIGLFIAVNDLVSILGYFSDIGLAASLIQKKAKVTLTDLRTTFTLQQVLVILLLIITLSLAPRISAYYHISGSGMWLLYSLLAAFFLASLKTIPSVILERHLQFKTLAAVEVAETLVFYFVAVLLAWQGRGVTAYAWAVILRGLVGTILIYWLAPWKLGLSVSVTSLKTLLSFGLPFQINTFMAVIKDRLLNIFLWKIIGADGIGIIGWAQTWSQKPLRFVMDNVTKVTFPAYARLQDQPQQLRSALEKTLFFITLITFPVVGGMAAIAPQLIRIIPQYGKWEAALIPLIIFCFGSAWAAVSTPITNYFNAVGKVKYNSFLMMMWTVLTWLLIPPFAVKYGYIGVAYASGIIALSSIVPIIIALRLTHFNILNSFGKTAIATLSMLTASVSLSVILSATLTNLILNCLISGLVYILAVYLLVGSSLIADGQKFFHALVKKS